MYTYSKLCAVGPSPIVGYTSAYVYVIRGTVTAVLFRSKLTALLYAGTTGFCEAVSFYLRTTFNGSLTIEKIMFLMNCTTSPQRLQLLPYGCELRGFSC